MVESLNFRTNSFFSCKDRALERPYQRNKRVVNQACIQRDHLFVKPEVDQPSGRSKADVWEDWGGCRRLQLRKFVADFHSCTASHPFLGHRPTNLFRSAFFDDTLGLPSVSKAILVLFCCVSCWICGSSLFCFAWCLFVFCLVLPWMVEPRVQSGLDGGCSKDLASHHLDWSLSRPPCGKRRSCDLPSHLHLNPSSHVSCLVFDFPDLHLSALQDVFRIGAWHIILMRSQIICLLTLPALVLRSLVHACVVLQRE